MRAARLAALAPDARSGARLTTILLVGRVIVGGVDYLCRVRNVSEGGMLVDCDAPVAIGDAITIELRNLNVVTARVVWTNLPRFGIAFDEPHVINGLLQTPPARIRERPRSPRLSADCGAVLWNGTRPIALRVLDLSQTGCGVVLSKALPAEGDLWIAIPGLPSARVEVRWSRGREVGFRFVTAISYETLAGWQRDMGLRFTGR